MCTVYARACVCARVRGASLHGRSVALCRPVVFSLFFSLWPHAAQFTHENVDEDAAAAGGKDVSSVVYEIKGVGFVRVGLNTAASEVRCGCVWGGLGPAICMFSCPCLPMRGCPRAAWFVAVRKLLCLRSMRA